MVVAIDPGPVKSAVVLWDGKLIRDFGIYENGYVLDLLTDLARNIHSPWPCAIEMIASYGMAVGAEVFETCVWIGRFMQAYSPNGIAKVERVPRLVVKMHLCHTARANDSNIRTALIDRFGGKDVAIGKKNEPGPLYSVKADLWAALALAVTWMDQKGT